MINPSHDRDWHPNSWRKFPIRQQPQYDQLDHLHQIEQQLRCKAGVVANQQTHQLLNSLQQAALGQQFVLQAGDCAEPFADADPEVSKHKYLNLMIMATWLELLINQPVVIIGRIAGQFSKPRSQLHEPSSLPNQPLIPVFRGDLVHSFATTPQARRPDPDRLLLGSYLSEIVARDLNVMATQLNRTDCLAALMNHIQASQHSSLHHALTARYNEPIDLSPQLPPLFFSHEALLLNYEQAFSRYSTQSGQYYNQGAHFLWLGNRTRHLGEAHIEYMRGIANPIGVKLGPSTTPAELKAYLKVLNPQQIPAKLTLILRFGRAQVRAKLHELIPVVTEHNIPVVWMMDPMHGQWTYTPSGQKTRYIEVMLAEVGEAMHTLKQFGEHLSGLHLETSHELVNECIYQADHHRLSPDNHLTPYTSQCDPRLNLTQVLDMIWQLFGDSAASH